MSEPYEQNPAEPTASVQGQPPHVAEVGKDVRP